MICSFRCLAFYTVETLTPPSKCPGEMSDVHRGACDRKISQKFHRGALLVYRGQHNYGWETVFTHRNNFINLSPGFVNLRLGFHLWGILYGRDHRLVRGPILLHFFTEEITGVEYTGALSRGCT